MIGTKILETRKSKYNGALRVVSTWGMGTYIQSDGLTQSGGIVESIWKSTLRHIRHTNIQSVLILGLGGGTVAKLINKTWPMAKITGIDIDPVMVELGKKYLGLDELSIKIHIGDAAQYTKYDIPHTKYDLVIVDLYNGDKFPQKFEQEKFIKKISENKMVIFNRLSYKGKKEAAENFGHIVEKFFTKVEVFRPVTNLMFISSK